MYLYECKREYWYISMYDKWVSTILKTHKRGYWGAQDIYTEVIKSKKVYASEVVGDAGGHVLVRVVRPDRDSLDEKETKTDTSEEITWVRKI
jgi:hypothetical protein